MARTIALCLLACALPADAGNRSGENPYGIGLYPPTRARDRADRYRPNPYRVDPYRRNPYDLTDLYASGYRPFRPGPYGYAAYRARSGRNDGYMARAPWPGYAPRDAVLRRQLPSYSDFTRFDPYRDPPPPAGAFSASLRPPDRVPICFDLVPRGCVGAALLGEYAIPEPAGRSCGCVAPTTRDGRGATRRLPGEPAYLGF